MIPRRTILAASLLALTAPSHAQTPGPIAGATLGKLHIGQATPAVSFLPLQAARALGSFAAAGLDLYWVALPGGDPACLTALGHGDIEFAAVGADSLLSAIADGQPFQMVASLMGKVSLELVASNALVEKSGVAIADDPLDQRLSVLKGATIGVSARGGAQERAARWLAQQAGLDPAADIKVAIAGPPTALQAALQTGQIDAFVLSPPAGLLAEDARIGQVVVRMADEFPQLHKLPALVLAVKTPVGPETKALLVAACKALQAASAALLADPAGVSARIQDKLYPRIGPPVMAAAIDHLKDGIADRGRFDPAGIAALVRYAGTAAAGLDTAPDGFWTNQYWDAAAT